MAFRLSRGQPLPSLPRTDDVFCCIMFIASLVMSRFQCLAIISALTFAFAPVTVSRYDHLSLRLS